MRARSAIVLLSFLLMAAAAAGCAEEAGPTGSDAKPADGEPLPGAPLDATSSVPAPRWVPGQWWEWELSFGTEVRDETFRSVVPASGRVLLTERDGMAKEEAVFGNPVLGEVGANLEMDGFGGSWDLLDFPLADGKTWTATIPNIAWDVLAGDSVDVAMGADFDPELQGFRFMGHVEQGMLLEGTYLPATGWFGELLLYDIDEGEEGLEVGFRAASAGLNYTGPLFAATASPLLTLMDGSGLDAPPPEGQPFVQPQPSGSFTMGTGTLLFGYIEAAAVAGTRVVTLTDPNNSQRQVVAQGTPEGQQLLWIDEPGIAGEWRLATAGAGGFSGTFVELAEITLVETSM